MTRLKSSPTVVFGDKYAEQWAFVTEPYIEPAQAKRIEYLARDAFEPWAIEVHILSPSRSAWNPGSCTPIVATFRKNEFHALLRHALAWGLGTGP